MFVKNDTIGIDSDKVAASKSLDDLREWEMQVYEAIESVKLQIANLKDSDTVLDSYSGKPVGLQKKINFMKLQEVLRKQINFRIGTLNRVIEPLRIQKERDYWKSKIKYFLPTMFESMCTELEDTLNNRPCPEI
jgi:hypothetical protein